MSCRPTWQGYLRLSRVACPVSSPEPEDANVMDLTAALRASLSAKAPHKPAPREVYRVGARRVDGGSSGDLDVRSQNSA